MTKIVCPFCLYEAERNDFVHRVKGGISEKRYRCPECATIFTKRLSERMLIMDWCAYGEWVAWNQDRVKMHRIYERLGSSYQKILFQKAYLGAIPAVKQYFSRF